MTKVKYSQSFVSVLMVTFAITPSLLAKEVVKTAPVTRYVSQVAEEEAIYYYSQRGAEPARIEKFIAQRWSQTTPQDRSDKLIKFYFANTRERSNSGLKHLACYLGDGNKIKETFFNAQNEMRDIRFDEEQGILVSDDGLMMGLLFYTKFNRQDEITLNFRLSHCISSGKTPILRPQVLEQAKLWTPGDKRKVAAKEAPLSAEETEFRQTIQRMPAQAKPVPEDGYRVNIDLGAPERGLITQQKLDLPRFELHDPFITREKVRTKRVVAEDLSRFPWRGMNVRQPNSETAERLSHELFKYFIEGMINKNAPNNPDQHFNAGLNTRRGWCQMPWMNVGDTGREAIHGLTKERDLEPSDIYPETKNGITGSDWGIGYYNSIACDYLANVFTAKTHRMTGADWYRGPFPDGSMSFKILFTTAPLNILSESLKWWAHVSLPGESARTLRQVKLLQVDIALKDTQLVPRENGTDGWMMSTLYFDPQYDWSRNEWNKEWLKRNPLPASLRPLLKLRPVGIQTGFTPDTFTLIQGSKTNVVNHAGGLPDGSLLNGPADNPTGSCMGCHGAAGTFSPMVSLVPGVMSKEQYQAIPANKKMDFSMQLGFAKRFYQTSVKK